MPKQEGNDALMEELLGDDVLPSDVDYAKLKKFYDPDQPRDPAGTETGGRWTSGGGGTWAASGTAGPGSPLPPHGTGRDFEVIPGARHGRAHPDEIKAVQERVLDPGTAEDREYALIWDLDDNQVHGVYQGQATAVELTDEQMEEVANGGGTYAFHHNHPGDGTLSIPDIVSTYSAPGIKEVWAHGDRGSVYQVMKINGYGPAEVIEAGHAAHNAVINTLKDDFRNFVASIDPTSLSDRHAAVAKQNVLSRMHQHAVLSAMSKAGVFEYNYKLSDKWARDYKSEENRALFNRAVDNAVMAIATSGISPKFVWHPEEVTVTHSAPWMVHNG